MFYRSLFFTLGLLLCAMVLLPVGSSGQYGNIWAFGDRAGVDFNGSTPVAIKTKISTNEGSASICDENGRLLFYTDGSTAWDRNHNVMPNGVDLPGVGVRNNITASTSQGALIVPVPGDEQRYYVFSLGQYLSRYQGWLYYSVVDMSLNNGLGDIDTSNKGKLLSKGLTEKMTAVSGDNCNIWLLTASRSLNQMLAYSIDYRGIDTVPIASPMIVGTGYYTIIGTMDISPDRTKVAVAQGNLILYDFDAGTGVFSNSFKLEPTGERNFYGVAFSPDNSKLYASGEGDLFYQYDLSSKDTNIMLSTRTTLGTAWAIKRGPDGKMYAATAGPYLSVVHQPNLAGKACQFEAQGLKLADSSTSILGLPNSATIVVNKKFYSSAADTALCADSFLLVPRMPSGFNHKWEDGSTGPGHQVKKSGIYWVSYQAAAGKCEEYVDTFHIAFYPIVRNYSSTLYTGMCKTDTIVMKPKTNAAEYSWNDGSTARERKITQTGTYWVAYRIDSLCGQYADTFIVDYPAKEYEVSFMTDTLACVGDPVSFNNTSDSPFDHFEWFFGDQDSATAKYPIHSYTRGGHYSVVLIGKIGSICADTAVRLIAIDSVYPLAFLMDKSRICEGESITFYPRTDERTLGLHWSFGDGGRFSGSNEQRVDHAYDFSGVLAVNLRADNRICPETSFTDTVYVYALPQIVLGPDTGLCLGGRAVVLQNLGSSPQVTYHNLWSTGDTSSILQVVYPGLYSLTITTEPLGCNTTESILIRKDCYIDIPNAFSPNGDGENDYFLPRQLLSKKLSRFNMQIFNRWGQLVFETFSVNGRGWDGRFDGKEQPGGVYVYKIDAEVEGHQQQYQGNVTLIR